MRIEIGKSPQTFVPLPRNASVGRKGIMAVR
jgi:hypothetical protein